MLLLRTVFAILFENIKNNKMNEVSQYIYKYDVCVDYFIAYR